MLEQDELKFAAMIKAQKLFDVKQAKLVKLYAIGRHDIRKIAVLIRSAFGINPNDLSDKEFGQLGTEAMWVKTYEAELLASNVGLIIAKAFGG